MRRNNQGQTGVEEKRSRKTRSVRDCALSLLERSDKTAQEMRQKLKEREYQQEEIEETLEEYHYVDDEEYVRKYIRSYGARKSARRIRAELEKRGVDAELIEAGMAEIPVDEEEQIAVWIRKKGYETDQQLEPEKYRKLTAALARRGYSFEMIRKVTAQMY